jgi:oligopeptide transport system ATP-binding protein
MIEILDLKVYFPIYGGKIYQKKTGDIKAVDGVSLSIKKREILSIVGESGCGKTTLAKAILGLVPKSAGKIFFEGQDLDRVSGEQRKELSRRIQYVPQDPDLSLNPTMRIIEAASEGIEIHKLVKNKKEKEEMVIQLLKLVKVDPVSMYRYPIEFSAGQRQRIAIVRALAVNPSLLICDEPVSSLDVSVQDQILKLLLDLRDKLGLTLLFITHDLAVVKMISDRVAIMYLGKIMEMTEKMEFYKNPLHPYTKILLSAVPIPDPERARNRKRERISEEVPSAEHIPSGCRFHTRCPQATKECQEREPQLVDVGNGHLVACHKVC